MNKGLEYWKQNAEEDYAGTPISVLKYISKLEEATKDEPVLAPDTEPISGQNMEQEARDMFEEYKTSLCGLDCICEHEATTALTEFGKMWYERGREEESEAFHFYKDTTLKATERIVELREKLEAKDKDIEFYLKKWDDSVRDVVELQQQLAEKDKEYEWACDKINEWREHSDEGWELVEKKDIQLTAAKAEIERLKEWANKKGHI